MDIEAKQILSAGLASLNITASQEYCDTLIAYAELIEAGNHYHSFVAASGRDLVVKHILDSLAPVNIFTNLIAANRYNTIGDFGTGAGLPGIPLALTFPDIHFTLIDRMTKRIQFLESVIAKLSINNVTVLETQAEHCKMQFDIVTFRAFHPFEYKLFKKLFKLCTPNGVIAAYKGKQDRVHSEIIEIANLMESYTVKPLTVPYLNEERCLVIIKPRLH
ncbi:MAG TPA: 16S rRNA (guanine(527)-N(7))-methyltransferase RsmG [Spirochaetales bacterium]|nr:16S rRNA (guanine(527)-N(7))-methyltransferase RsmG [Spirochaetales bacterium]HQK34796.1 16S rRNA (guanine(527)-N(7))-methyltransferase RsmG [Spirochaetales bacterium]